MRSPAPEARHPPSPPAIALRNATLGYRGRPVLSGVEVEVSRGEFIGLLGPNGAGKTTLIRAVLGLVSPLAGRVEVFGQPAKRGNGRVGYLPQLRAEPARQRLTGRAFVCSAASGTRWGLPWASPAEQRDVDRALALVDATGLADRRLHELSGGQQQRLLLAQALLGAPGALLLDEPLLSLDPRRQAEVIALVRHLADTLGLAVLFSAHELNPLLGAMDRVLYLGGGRAAIGTVDAVVTGPVLSRLYGAPIEVVRAGNRIFVVGAGNEVAAHAERDVHVGV